MFTRRISNGLIVEVDEYIVRVKDGERVIEEFKYETYAQARLAAARIEDDLNKVCEALCL